MNESLLHNSEVKTEIIERYAARDLKSEREHISRSPSTIKNVSSQKTLAFADYVAASITHFVAFEVGDMTDGLSCFGPVTAGGMRAVVSVVGMEMIIDVAVETLGAMKPGAGADEDATSKPLRAIIAVGSAIVGRNVIVAVGAHRRNSDIYGNLSLRFGSINRKTNCSNCS